MSDITLTLTERHRRRHTQGTGTTGLLVYYVIATGTEVVRLYSTRCRKQGARQRHWQVLTVERIIYIAEEQRPLIRRHCR